MMGRKNLAVPVYRFRSCQDVRDRGWPHALGLPLREDGVRLPWRVVSCPEGVSAGRVSQNGFYCVMWGERPEWVGWESLE